MKQVRDKTKYIIIIFLFSIAGNTLTGAEMSADEKEIEKLFYRGEKYYFQKKYDIAYSVLQRVVERKPDHVRALPLLADVAFFRGDFPAALKYYQQAVDLVSDPYQEYYRMGQIYLLMKKPDSAIAQFKNALKYNELLSIANFQLGFIYFSQKKDLHNAKKYWELFLQQSPDDAQSETIRGVIKKIDDGEIRFPNRELYEVQE